MRSNVIDVLTREQVHELAAIADAILQKVDSKGLVASLQRR